MSKFNAGDKVIVNKGLIAEIRVYDEDANLVTYAHAVQGGENVVYAHISNTDIEPFPALEVPLAEAPAVEDDDEPDEAA